MLQNLYKQIISSTLSDEKDFCANKHDWEAFKLNIETAKKDFAGLHHIYVNTISSASMAASLELAAVCYALCLKKTPRRLLDLGSGFSSFVFRKYSRDTDTDCVVVSVDDDEAWLGKTRDYLALNKVSTDKLFTFNDFLQTKEDGFDIVLHDMNFVEVRKLYIEDVINRTAKGGLIVFDDVHKTDYFHDVVKTLRLKKMKFYNFKKITTDAFNRFAIIAVK